MNTAPALLPPSRNRPNPLWWLLIWGWLLWTIVVTGLVQGGVLLWAWSTLLSKSTWPLPRILALSLAAPLLVLVPGAVLLLARERRQAAVVRTLLLAAGAALLLLLPRVLLDPTATLAAAALRLLVAGLLGVVLLRRAASRQYSSNGLRTHGGLMLLLAVILLLPWLVLGALGDGFDTAVAFLQALALAALLSGLAANLMPQLQATSPEHVKNLWLGGIVLATAGFVLAGGWGQMDVQALLAGVLPALGFPLAFAQRQQRRYAVGGALLLATVVCFGPFAFADPRETNLISLLDGDVARWTLWATTLDFLLGWAIALVLGLVGKHLLNDPWPALWRGTAVLAVIGAAVVYFTSGQPGFYGDDFFVVMKRQADVQAAFAIDDLVERRTWVYQTLTAEADASQADLLAWLDARHIPYTRYYLVNGVEVHAPAWRRWQIAQRADVDRILYSPTLRPLPQPPAPAAGQPERGDLNPWGIEAIEAPRVWAEFGVTGEGIVVGQSDSGVDAAHPALAGGYRGKDGDDAYNWYDPWQQQPHPYDLNGHGTHTLGIAVGRDGIGVAPGATWFACANLVRDLGNPANYLDCMQFMLAPHPPGGDPLHDGRPELAADVSTNSWGCPPLLEGCDQQTLWVATEALRAAGIFVVVAAGNDGPACDSLQTPPGNYGDVLSVGAIDAQGNLTPFSSRGPHTLSPDGARGPTLLAPGDQVLSAWPGDAWFVAQGTSMAAPHVAGVVALMWSANPALRGDIASTRQILIDTATPYDGASDGCGEPGEMPDSGAGYGIVNAYEAVREALARR